MTTTPKPTKSISEEASLEPAADRLSKKKITRHNLRQRFEGKEDAEVIDTLNSFGSIRRFSLAELNDTEGKPGRYHGAVIFYLINHRPNIIAILERDAKAMAKAWPANWPTLNEQFSMAGWWSYSLKKSFRKHLTKRFARKSPKDWADAVWSVKDDILASISPEEREELRTPSKIEDRISGRTFIPTVIRDIRGNVIHGLVHRELRKRFKAFLKASATPVA
jgi:hypothetical protein